MSQIDVYTLWNVISQQRNKIDIQVVLCLIQKALEKHSNTSIVLRVFKQAWWWYYNSMNVSGYWSIIGKWRMLLKFNDVGGWTRCTLQNHKHWRCWEIRLNMLSMTFHYQQSKRYVALYCGRRWTFWTCTGLRKFKE